MFLRLKALAAAVVVAAAFGVSAPSAEAREVAQRCDEDGCNYIYCNWSGDRCYRVDETRDGERIYRGFYGDGHGDRRAGYRRYDVEDRGRHRGNRHRDRSEGNPYYRPHHRRGGRDRHKDLDAPYSPEDDDSDGYGPDDRYQDRYRYDDRW